MKNRQHKYILKAFLESSIPAVIRRDSLELLAVDSVIGGYCTCVLKGAKTIDITSDELILKSQKIAFSDLINCSSGAEKDELIVYYRLLILVECILLQYRQR